jgi:hypothetical protein
LKKGILTIHADMIKVHFPLLKIAKTDAIVLYPFLLHKDKTMSNTLLNHERIHFDQIKKYGLLFFYFDYLRQYLKMRIKGMSHNDSYKGISYEKEAYENQNKLDYKV